MYKTLSKLAEKIFNKSQIFKYGFNLSPMYRRSTGKVISVSNDLLTVKIKIPISYKNKNYVGSIFGGSLFSATDPIYMIQLLNILGDNYVVWDKSAEIKYRRPAKKDAFASFIFSWDEIERIKQEVTQKGELDWIKNLQITDDNQTVFCELEKTMYIATKEFYKQKRKKRNS
jgi:acyl-coenzyme A thioesterase PaaI-like protein